MGIEIEMRVIEAVGEIIELPDDTDRDLRIADLGADSLDIAEIIFEIEEEFDIDIDDDVVNNLVTIGDIVDYVENHVVM